MMMRQKLVWEGGIKVVRGGNGRGLHHQDGGSWRGLSEWRHKRAACGGKVQSQVMAALQGRETSSPVSGCSV